MISKIIVPDLGATGVDVTLMEWLVEPGQAVTAGQSLFLVETDKATVEVEAFRDGVVRTLLVEPGDSLALGSVVAIIADSMEETMDEDAAVEFGSDDQAPTAEITAEAMPAQPVDNKPGEDRIFISPLARRMALQEGINLSAVQGSGIRGQILKRDVEQSVAPPQPEFALTEDVRRVPLSPMQAAIARRTSQSKTQAPHFYARITVDMAAILASRQKAVDTARAKDWAAPTITDICLLATARTLPDFPTLNASFQGDEIFYYRAINIGLVVGLDDGRMLVPVVRDADAKDIYTIATTSRHLKQQARSAVLGDKEMSGSTFTISNLGMYGLDSFTAVINPPQAGILALGAVIERPAVRDGEVVPRPLMEATLSVDHRLVDGIIAARFLAAWKELLEEPGWLLPESLEESES